MILHVKLPHPFRLSNILVEMRLFNPRREVGYFKSPIFLDQNLVVHLGSFPPRCVPDVPSHSSRDFTLIQSIRIPEAHRHHCQQD